MISSQLPVNSVVYVNTQSNSHTIIITAALTLIGGLILFILSNIFLKLILEPVQEMKKVIGEIHEETIYYSNLYHNPLIIEPWVSKRKPTDEQTQNYRDGSEKLRRLSARLRATENVIPLYEVTRRLFALPSSSKVDEAARRLIFLHNSMYQTGRGDKWVDAVLEAEGTIQKNLGIKINN
jgi:hypothetical protein